jgi:hypothetical protein
MCDFFNPESIAHERGTVGVLVAVGANTLETIWMDVLADFYGCSSGRIR